MKPHNPNFTDDLTVTPETCIYISWKKFWQGVAICLAIVALMVYGAIDSHNHSFVLWFIALAPLLLIFFLYRKHSNREPQIIINAAGIRTAATDFFPWEEIGNEGIVDSVENRVTVYKLAYDCPQGREEFIINNLDITQAELIRLLAIYRGRSGKDYKYASNHFLED